MVLIYVLFVLGVGLGWRALTLRGGPRAPPATSPPWGRADLAVLPLLLGFLAVLVWLAAYLPVTGGEASRLEPEFWQRWFLSPSRGAHPPCCRLLTHLTASVTTATWLLRGVTSAAWILGLAVLYTLLRRRTTPTLAVALTLIWVISGVSFSPELQRCKYALWLPSLLLAHGAFEEALERNPRRWLGYTWWMWLACLTHYFTVAYAAGHLLFVLRRRRDEVRPLLAALITVGVSLAPFAWAAVHFGLDGVRSARPGDDLAPILLKLLLDTAAPWGLPILLFYFAFRLPSSASDEEHRRGSEAVPAMLLLGVLLPFFVLAKMRVSIRLLLPLLPLCLLWLGRRMAATERPWRPSIRWMTGVALTLIALLGVTVAVEIGIVLRGNLWHQYARRTERMTGGLASPRVLLVYPGAAATIVAREASGRLNRELWGATGRPIKVSDHTTVTALPDRPPPQVLDAALRSTGGFDLLWYDPPAHPVSPQTLTWLGAHCHLLVNVDGTLGAPGKAYRCRRR